MSSEVQEGFVRVLVPKNFSVRRDSPVFYNPDKKFDRTISVAVLSVLLKNKSSAIVCDCLAATGVRGLRYAAEVPNIDEVILNDINPNAYGYLKRNIELNRDKIKCKVSAYNEDANYLLLRLKGKLDVLDIDPFGSPIPFLDRGVKSLKKGGVLAITATDIATLCGVNPKISLRKYSSLISKTEYRAEVGYRVLLRKVIEIGAQYKLALYPVFGYFLGSYYRLFFKVDRGTEKAYKLLRDFGFILHCKNCLYRHPVRYSKLRLADKCPNCGGELNTIGPLFLGELWDEVLCEEVYGLLEDKQAKSLLKTIVNEAKIREISYYTTDSLCENLKCREPRLRDLELMLTEAGYSFSYTHFSTKGFRTSAPLSFIKSAIRKLVV